MKNWAKINRKVFFFWKFVVKNYAILTNIKYSPNITIFDITSCDYYFFGGIANFIFN